MYCLDARDCIETTALVSVLVFIINTIIINSFPPGSVNLMDITVTSSNMALFKFV